MNPSEQVSIEQVAGCLPSGFTVDSLLNPTQCRIWMNLKEREFSDRVRKKQIPCLEYGERTKRFHPRTIIESIKTEQLRHN